jgi:phosphatidylserine/phosphatidylglycerophosphate/cardiolipin synthase-like enzyme
MNATAISNNDMVYLHWHFECKIADCLGYTVIRHEDDKGPGVPLPAMVGFPEDKLEGGARFKDTSVWPIQKFSWKDLFAKRGGTYWYEIIPMIGTPGALTPDATRAMRTNSVSLNSKRGSCSVFFNRGIISTQALAQSLPKNKAGLPSSGVLQKEIQDPNSEIRKRLVGDLETGVLSLIARAKSTDGAEVYCALYELSDKDLIEHLKSLGDKAHLILSNAGDDTEEGSGDGDSTNHDARGELHDLGMDVSDRMLKKGHIGHNKFVVYVENEVAQAVLCGSTNWTATGLCAQSNNSVVIASAALAGDYWKYWKRLKADTKAAGKDSTQLQAGPLRNADKKANKPHALEDNAHKASGNVHVWFSPNTPQKSVPRAKKGVKSPKPPPTPPDLSEVFDLIENAKQGALFLAFIPGSPSIVSKLKEVYAAKRKKGQLFYLRGAATSPDPANLFRVDLYHRSATSDATVLPVENPPVAETASAGVASVAGIFATFAAWEAEIYKIGHAVIHDKILVIDPFTDDGVVVTGSHNLGFKASYSNDENLVIIRNDRGVSEAYAAHVLDVYEHYRWRWRIQAPIRAEFDKLKAQHPKANAGDLWKQAVQSVGPEVIQTAWHNLNPNPSWQNFYVDNKNFLAAENNFWSAFGGIGLSNGAARDPAIHRTPRPQKSASRRKRPLQGRKP